MLGIGESVAYPSYSKILARYFSEENRGFANSVIVAGNTLGPGFGMLLGGMLMARYGWRSFFIVLGLVSLVWLLPWLRWMPREQTVAIVAPATTQVAKNFVANPGLIEILRQRSAWGSCAGLFCTNYVAYFLITWLPFYLVRGRHFSMDQMARIAGVSYLSAAVMSILGGWISDRWIIAGASPTRVRKTFMGVGMTCVAAFLTCCVVSKSTLSEVMLVMAMASFGMCSSNMWGITQTLAGPKAAGRWTGFQNFFGNVAGVVAPALTGFIVDRTGEFFWAFAITAGVALIGAWSWVFFVGPIRQIEWQQEALRVGG